MDNIAIIGIGCRFPGAKTPDTFWQNLRSGVDGITEVSPERWDLDALYDPEAATPGKMNILAGVASSNKWIASSRVSLEFLPVKHSKWILSKDCC